MPTKKHTFGEVADAAYTLPLDHQEELIKLLQARLREKKRKRLLKNVQQARKEYKQGKARIVTPRQLIEEAMS